MNEAYPALEAILWPQRAARKPRLVSPPLPTRAWRAQQDSTYEDVQPDYPHKTLTQTGSTDTDDAERHYDSSGNEAHLYTNGHFSTHSTDTVTYADTAPSFTAHSNGFRDHPCISSRPSVVTQPREILKKNFWARQQVVDDQASGVPLSSSGPSVPPSRSDEESVVHFRNTPSIPALYQPPPPQMAIAPQQALYTPPSSSIRYEVNHGSLVRQQPWEDDAQQTCLPALSDQPDGIYTTPAAEHIPPTLQDVHQVITGRQPPIRHTTKRGQALIRDLESQVHHMPVGYMEESEEDDELRLKPGTSSPHGININGVLYVEVRLSFAAPHVQAAAAGCDNCTPKSARSAHELDAQYAPRKKVKGVSPGEFEHSPLSGRSIQEPSDFPPHSKVNGHRSSRKHERGAKLPDDSSTEESESASEGDDQDSGSPYEQSETPSSDSDFSTKGVRMEETLTEKAHQRRPSKRPRSAEMKTRNGRSKNGEPKRHRAATHTKKQYRLPEGPWAKQFVARASQVDNGDLQKARTQNSNAKIKSAPRTRKTPKHKQPAPRPLSQNAETIECFSSQETPTSELATGTRKKSYRTPPSKPSQWNRNRRLYTLEEEDEDEDDAIEDMPGVPAAVTAQVNEVEDGFFGDGGPVGFTIWRDGYSGSSAHGTS